MKLDGMNPAPPVTRTRLAICEDSSGARRVARPTTPVTRGQTPAVIAMSERSDLSKPIFGSASGIGLRLGSDPGRYRHGRDSRLELAVDRVQRTPLDVALDAAEILA